MTRLDFFVTLREGLKKLPPEEIENAVRYYTEYFDDAGPDSEQNVLRELGDPAKIAQQITAEYMVRGIVPAERPREKYKQPQEKKGLSAVWVAILAVFASPIALPIAVAIVIVALALVISAFAVLLAFFCASLGLIVGGIFGFILGCVVLGTHFPTGMCAMGCGAALLGIGVLLVLPTIWLSKAMFSGIAQFVSRTVLRGGKKA